MAQNMKVFKRSSKYIGGCLAFVGVMSLIS